MSNWKNKLHHLNSKFGITEEEIRQLNSIIRGDKNRLYFYDILWLLNAITITNNLEGYKVTMQETKMVYNKGKLINVEKEKLLSDFIVAYKNISENVIVPLTFDFLLNIHRLLVKNTDVNAGKFKSENNFVIEGYWFEEPEKVYKRLGDLLYWYNTQRSNFCNMSNYDIVVVLSKLKREFINIHPFIDGNGRMSRLLVQKELIFSGLFPILFNEFKRVDYSNIMNVGYHIKRDENVYLTGLLVKEILAVYNRGGYKYLKN